MKNTYEQCGTVYPFDSDQGIYLTEEKTETELLKILIPETEEMYLCETGEACYARVSREVMDAFDNGEEDTLYTGILDNDCIAHEALVHGMRIPFRMKGDCRPLVPWEWVVLASDTSHKVNE